MIYPTSALSSLRSFAWLWVAVVMSCPAAALASGTSASPAPEETPKIQVQALTPDADLSHFKDPRYQTHPAPSGAPGDGLPIPADRDQLFAKAGLTEAVKDMDAVDRDVLYMRARSTPMAKLKSHYPKLSAAKLRKLQKLIGATEGRP